MKAFKVAANGQGIRKDHFPLHSEGPEHYASGDHLRLVVVAGNHRNIIADHSMR
jgi:hypothetical protein